MSFLRRYLVAGLLVWVPLGVTMLVVSSLIQWMDGSLLLIPEPYRPENLLGFPIPGQGVLLSLVILFVTGILAANFFGRSLVALWERLMARIPLVRSVYSGTKQLAETLFSGGGESFRKVLLVEFPRRGLWTLAFQTGHDLGEARPAAPANIGGEPDPGVLPVPRRGAGRRTPLHGRGLPARRLPRRGPGRPVLAGALVGPAHGPGGDPRPGR